MYYNLDADDLERVTFYQDKEEGVFYFVPADEQIIKMLNSGGEERMFIFKFFETRPHRVITPQPDPVRYYVCSKDVGDIRNRMVELGTAEMNFPAPETIEHRGWADNTLTENEYTQAVTDMIHGTLVGEQYYGNYEIYIAEYFMTNDVGTHEEEFDGIAVGISAAVVCLDDGYGYYCNFRASDQLIDGEVRIYFSLPDTANAWEEEIANAMEDRRLVISLEVKPGDEIEVPQSPYPFVMLPILDYAVGEGRFPEGALYSDTMVFY